MAKTTVATTAEPKIKRGPPEVSDAELEDIVGGHMAPTACAACGCNL